MNIRACLPILRTAFALLALTAIGVQLSIHIRSGFDVVNFFSFFTNLSNLCAAGVLLFAATRGPDGRHTSERFDLVRGASVVSMAMVGIIFVAALRNEDLGSLRPWVSAVLHYIMPLVVVLDWVIAPPERVPSFRQSLLWLTIPTLYFIYTLVRGAAIGWYPYPFFNPSGANGYRGVVVASIVIATVFFLMGVGVRAVARRTGRH